MTNTEATKELDRLTMPYHEIIKLHEQLKADYAATKDKMISRFVQLERLKADYAATKDKNDMTNC